MDSIKKARQLVTMKHNWSERRGSESRKEIWYKVEKAQEEIDELRACLKGMLDKQPPGSQIMESKKVHVVLYADADGFEKVSGVYSSDEKATRAAIVVGEEGFEADISAHFLDT